MPSRASRQAAAQGFVVLRSQCPQTGSGLNDGPYEISAGQGIDV